MENTEFLLMINALLMSLLGAGLSVICFFLKDVYRDHKKLQEKVNALQREVATHHRLSQERMHLMQQQSDRNREQIEQLTYQALLARRIT
ncbi:MAG: hypothetical protein ACFB15_12605 [Cyclobacteriaceae bacterium]